MKVRNLIMVMMLLLAGLQTVSAQTAMKVWKDKSFVLYRIQQVDSIQFVLLVNDIALSQDAVELEKGKSVQLTATVSPEEADIKTVAWSSSIPGIASVDENGVVTAERQGMCIIICSATDGSDVKAQCQMTVKDSGQVDPDEHQWVDLGLPSGTLWATCNVGANSPEEYGDYFAWGETAPKDYYDWSTYLDTYDNGSSFKKYRNNGGLTELLPEDDAATANWGSPWRMPSLDQLKELLNISYTTTEWTTLNDVYGRKITSKSNGNSIFLPAAGHRWNDEFDEAGGYGYYWSSSLGPFDDSAYNLYFPSGGWDWGNYGFRDIGRSVRAVRP